MENQTSPTVPALVKALDILEYLAGKGFPATIKELAVDLDIPPATAYRTVKYLASRRYLLESPRLDGAYEFGPQISFLSHLYTKQSNLIVKAHAAIKELADTTGQTAQLAILQDFGVTYIDQCLPTTPVSIIATLRAILPINVSACGKALVAHMAAAEQDYFLERATLASQTKKSIVDLGLLRQELAAVREQGYALDQEEYARGIGCAGAPIWDFRQQVVGAIGVTGHIAEYNDPERLLFLIASVQHAARVISIRIGALDDSEISAQSAVSGPSRDGTGSSASSD